MASGAELYRSDSSTCGGSSMSAAKKSGASLLNSDQLTANDRFKTRCLRCYWGGLIMATVAHFALFTFFPMLSAADVSYGVTEFAAIELPPEVEVPPPPEAIQRPAVPLVAQTDLEEDITIAPTTFEENPVEQLPPPPDNNAVGLSDQPTFTPFTVAPKLRDPEAAARIISEAYPKMLRDAGIGGEVVVWAFIDDKGIVKNCQVHQSSGYGALDQAALAAMVQFSFRPALNYDRHVPVWVQLPIVFKVSG